jgi:uncharacterized protein (DUF4213/DUF364 family)
MILEKTVELVKQIYKVHKIYPPKVSNVVLGLGYTGVEITPYALDPILGLASTLTSVINNTDCSKLKFAGYLTKIKLIDLLDWVSLAPSLKKIIGIATLNAVSQHIMKIKNPYSILNGDLLNFLEINQKTKITVIGLMKPLINQIIKITTNITLVEDTISTTQKFTKFKNITKIEELEEQELHTDILFCTGTTLINDSIEEILKLYKKKARKIVILGPTVSLLPDLLFDYGVDIVGGLEISNSNATLKILQEGGGTMLFKKFGKKYNLIKK